MRTQSTRLAMSLSLAALSLLAACAANPPTAATPAAAPGETAVSDGSDAKQITDLAGGPAAALAKAVRQAVTSEINMRKTMSEEEYQQEMECSFDAAVKGAYYGRLIDEAQQEGRICAVPHEPAAKVDTWWDLGVGDSTAIWFVQTVGREVRVIDHYEMTGEGLPHYAKVLASKPYVYGRHIAPHDIAVRELGTGQSRIEMARALGLKFETAPKLPVDDGINAVRLTLPKCWFDAKRCAAGLEALRMYRKDRDEKLNVFRDKPRHDWTSHSADAFRTGCAARPSAPVVRPARANGGFGVSPMAWAG